MSVHGNSERVPFAAKNTRPFVAPLISAPATVLVKYYTDARLVCNVTGYPQPSVRWEFEKVS